MIRITLDLAGDLYTEGIGQVLTRTGTFRVSAPPADGTLENKVWSCLREEPEILLLGVSLVDGYTVEQREELIRQVRQSLPGCRIVILVDERLSEATVTRVKQLKLTGAIDGFLFTSVSMEYLVAMLETVIDTKPNANQHNEKG